MISEEMKKQLQVRAFRSVELSRVTFAVRRSWVFHQRRANRCSPKRYAKMREEMEEEKTQSVVAPSKV